MIDTKLLRQKLIDMALRGLLVEQRPEEGNASDLLEQIRAEKAALIKIGKIKKEKPLPEIKEEENPFAIPDSWCWVRLGECTHLVGYSDNRVLEKDIHKSGAYPVISQGEKFIDGFSDEIVKVVKQLPLVLFGDHTKNVKYIDFPFIVGAEGVKLHSCIAVCSKYIYFWMLGTAAKLRNLGYARHYSLLKKVPIPLPPLAEQKRIVVALEACLELVDTIAKDSADLDKALKFLRQKMLDMAMRGQLVEQRPEEGKATDLLEQIRAEKAALIKIGKIKKEKPLSEIKEEEKPFAIPANWCWVRFSDVLDVRDGTHDTPKYVPTGIPLVTSKNFINGNIIFDTAKFISQEDADLINARSKVDTNDILLAMIGTIGNPVLIDKDRDFCIKNVALFKKVSELLLMKYVFYYLTGEQYMMRRKAVGGVQKFVSLNFLRAYLIPLPPLAEQKRIVAKLEQINALIETMLN